MSLFFFVGLGFKFILLLITLLLKYFFNHHFLFYIKHTCLSEVINIYTRIENKVKCPVIQKPAITTLKKNNAYDIYFGLPVKKHAIK